MDITGTSAIVTGAASGLGAATAAQLIERGAKVVGIDLPGGIEKAPQVEGLTYVAADVTNEEQVRAAVARAAAVSYTHLDVYKRQGQVRLDQHAPHGGRRAERGHVLALHLVHQRHGVEARVVVEEHGGTGDERREEVRPRVLGPPRRRHVQVHVPRLQPCLLYTSRCV